MHSSVLSLTTPGTATARYLSCLRLKEILVLQGAPLLGVVCALRHPAAVQVGPLAVLAAGSLCLMGHVFAVNDWANAASDLADPNRAARVFTVRGIARKEMGALAIGLLAAALLLFSRLGPATTGIAVGIAALSALYSLPPFNWKGRPFLSSAVHLVGGVLHFLLGYSLGGALDRRGLIVGAFCAVTFAAGHLTQELRDHQSDGRNAIRTNAVTFGQRRAFIASLVLFTLSHALLLALAVQGILPRVLAVLVVLYPVQLRWSLQALAGGLTHAGICRLQARYRVLYAMIGVAVAVALWGA